MKENEVYFPKTICFSHEKWRISHFQEKGTEKSVLQNHTVLNPETLHNSKYLIWQIRRSEEAVSGTIM